MSQKPKSPPERMRAYRIEAEPRETPDLHKLAHLFIGMAFARVDAERGERRPSSSASRQEPVGEVE